MHLVPQTTKNLDIIRKRHAHIIEKVQQEAPFDPFSKYEKQKPQFSNRLVDENEVFKEIEEKKTVIEVTENELLGM